MCLDSSHVVNGLLGRGDALIVIRSHYFEHRDIHVADGDLVALSCIRNEEARLPYFLEYYREQGVDRFLCVDNGSTDGSAEILRAQPDVEVFTTTASYRGSAAGRLWLQELADTYASGRWTLTVDVDELLVYPGAEHVPLKKLRGYLNRRGYEGLFTVMLDMYSDRPIGETTYAPGTPFLDTCHYFETDSYTLRPKGLPPFLKVLGGPRGRMYAASGEHGSSPSMEKVAMVKWRPGFSYVRSTHSHRHIPLADITGALLHFKFFASFQEGLVTEYRRGDRRQNHVYARYIDEIGPHTTFVGDYSHTYTSPSDLVGRGVLASSQHWRRYCTQVSERRKRPFDVDSLLPVPPEYPRGLESLATVWPIANNRGLASYFGLSQRGRRDPRASLIQDLSHDIEVVEVEERHVLLAIGERALHRWQPHGLACLLSVDDRVVGTVAADGTDDVLTLATDALEPNVGVWPVDVAAALSGEVGHVAVHLVDARDRDRPLPTPGEVWQPGPRDVQLFADTWHLRPVPSDATKILGRIERLHDGSVVGWVRDTTSGPRDIPLNLYVNGRLAVHMSATPDPDRDEDETSESEFSASVPIGYFSDLGAEEVVVEVRVAGTNIVLDRSPLTFPVDARSAEWSDRSGWRTVP